MSHHADIQKLFPSLLDGCMLIAVVGAGGKTSLIGAMAQAYASMGKRVIVATSTKTFVDDTIPLVLESQCSDVHVALGKTLEQHPVVAVGACIDVKNSKLVGLATEHIDAMKSWANAGFADVILCEADGAARKALKAPALHEPVIPKSADVCFGIMGFDVVERALTEELVHRAEIFSQLVQVPMGAKIQLSHLLCLAHHERGLFKNCPTSCARIVVLNKIDCLTEKSSLTRLQEEILQAQSPYSWWVGSVQMGNMISL